MTDPGDIAAWAALAAALLALLIASAQVAQQYAATAQNMRKCERSVWGPMPGHAGRRVWLWRQLRFRIVYDMPNIFLPSDYWQTPGNTRQFAQDRITTLPAPFDPRPRKRPRALIGVAAAADSMTQTRSEACWVSFSRQISQVCPSAVKVGLIAGDADRLPADLPVVPMQVSLRDIIALGLLTGLSLQSATLDHIEMSGRSGFLKSSAHPFLGHLIHFTCLSSNLKSILLSGNISKSWLRRLEGIATVARQEFDTPKRRYYISLGLRWRTIRVRVPFRPSAVSISGSDRAGEDAQGSEEAVFLQIVDLEGVEHSLPARECETWDQLVSLLEYKDIAKPPFIIRGLDNKLIAPRSWRTLHRVLCRGDLKIKLKIAEGEYSLLPPRGLRPAGDEKPRSSRLDDQVAMDLVHVIPERSQPALHEESTAVELQDLGKKQKKTKRRRKTKKAPMVGQKPLALTAWAHNDDHGSNELRLQSPSNDSESSKESSGTSSGESQKQVRRAGRTYDLSSSGEIGNDSDRSSDSYQETTASFVRESSRNQNSDDDGGSFIRMRPRFEYDTEAYWQNKMDYVYANPANPRAYVPAPPILSFFWASQIDIELGPWATPWASGLHLAARDALPMLTEVALAGLSISLGPTMQILSRRGEAPVLSEQIVFAQLPDHGVFGLDDLWARLRGGGCTWAPYAINARGGVTDIDTTLLVPFPVFGPDVNLPPLTLSQSVRDASLETSQPTIGSQDLARDRTLELASIDLWLSRAAMTKAIQSGGMDVVSIAPALVEELWLDFCNDVVRTYEQRWSRDGGDWAIRQLARDMTQEMSFTVNTASERCFVWVAFLRAVKVMQCINEGPRTHTALSIFRKDIPVYLV